MGEMKKDSIKVLVFGAHSLMRKGIISALIGEDDINVVGQASNRLELIVAIDNLNPNIVIIEDGNGTAGLETINLINQRNGHTKVLLLIKDYDEDKELAALKIGVKGFLTETVAEADLIKCIRAITNGEMWVRRRVLERLIRQFLALNRLNGDGYLNKPMPCLTKKELDIMMLVGKGYRNKQIGCSLSISEKTVKHYLSDIFKKLHVRKRVDIKWCDG